MARYRKKPIEVEAYKTDKEMIIHTLEGDMKANVGDYIITGIKGEQYPCKPEIFEATYEIPTADVVPKSEMREAVEKIMSATDKVICEAKAEIAREIFEEIEKHLVYYPRCCEYSIDERDYEKIKKKYTKESEGER